MDYYSRDLQLAKWGWGVSLHGSNSSTLMSAFAQKQTFAPSSLSPSNQWN
jgi:hypothetical protein